MKHIIGVDFGTSTSMVKTATREGDVGGMETKSVTFTQKGIGSTPTLIRKKEGVTWYGYAAEQMSIDGSELIRNFKLKLRSDNTKEYAQAVLLVEEFFAYLYQRYQEQKIFLFGAETAEEETWVSYPVQWDKAQRSVVLNAAEKAGFPNVHGIDEPTAAINCILKAKQQELEKRGMLVAGKPLKVMVLDMGAGTTDLAFITVTVDGNGVKTELRGVWPERGSSQIYGGSQMDLRLEAMLKQWVRDSGYDDAQAESIVNNYSDQIKPWKEITVSDLLAKGMKVTDMPAVSNYLNMMSGTMGKAVAPFPVLDGERFYKLFRPELNSFVSVIASAPQKLREETELVILTGGNSVWFWLDDVLIGENKKFGQVGLPRIAGKKDRILRMEQPADTVSRGLVYDRRICVVSPRASQPGREEPCMSAQEQYELGNRYFYGIDEQDYAEAVKWYRKAAEQGNVDAMNSLGVCYYEGYGVAQDYAEAVKWFRRAEREGNTSALYHLGKCYALGTGVTQDYPKGMYYYRKAAEQGIAAAQAFLDIFDPRGNGITPAEAVEWYRKAADQGNATAQYNLGQYYEDGNGVAQDYTEAVKWYRKAAEYGNSDAQLALGLCYEEGKGVTQNYTEAVKWYRKAAEQGDAVAQNNLGVCYYYGNGVAQDYAEAVKWYRKAAEQGNANAQCELGLCYFWGEGVTRDYAKAVKWFRKAAEQGDSDAQGNLGECYHSGYGVAQDDTEAVKWFRKAAEQGNADAQGTLGACYSLGSGVAQNHAEAVKWYRKAADQGDAYGQSCLGNHYYLGYGVKQDFAEAVKWYKKAADQGDADALYHLGTCYEDGIGVVENREEAKRYYQMAAQLGLAEARDALKKLNGTMKY